MAGDEGEFWFMRKLLGKIVERNRDLVQTGRIIPKEALYRQLSWWYRLRRDETKTVLRALATTFPGVEFKKHGLRVSSVYTDPSPLRRRPRAVLSATEEGDDVEHDNHEQEEDVRHEQPERGNFVGGRKTATADGVHEPPSAWPRLIEISGDSSERWSSQLRPTAGAAGS